MLLLLIDWFCKKWRLWRPQNGCTIKCTHLQYMQHPWVSPIFWCYCHLLYIWSCLFVLCTDL